MEELYKSNTNKSRSEEPQREPKVIDESLKGEVNLKKKSFGRRVYDTFFADDISTIKSYVVQDVIVPYVKSILSEAFNIALFGSGGGPNRTRTSGNASRRSYDRYYDQRASASSSGRILDLYSYDDVTVDTYPVAMEVIKELKETLEDYPMVTVGDLKNALTSVDKNKVFTPSTNDWSWGWDADAIDTITVSKVRDGYLIKLPKAQRVK